VIEKSMYRLQPDYEEKKMFWKVVAAEDNAQ
jgi:hypothetical protein